MGGATMRQVASHPAVEIVALCDVDWNVLQQAAKQHPQTTTHTDFRDLLVDHTDRFDAVTIGILGLGITPLLLPRTNPTIEATEGFDFLPIFGYSTPMEHHCTS